MPNHPVFIRLSATILADWRTNVAQNVRNVDVNKEGELFGLCCDHFGPKPLCFWTGYSPRAPLNATSHTFHNPIHSNKYIQNCNLEWLLICQITCCQSKMWAWKPELVPTLITNLERKRHGFSQRNPVTVGETHKQLSFLLESKKTGSPLMLPINSDYESTCPNRIYNSEILQCILFSFGRYLEHNRPQSSVLGIFPHAERLMSCTWNSS